MKRRYDFSIAGTSFSFYLSPPPPPNPRFQNTILGKDMIHLISWKSKHLVVVIVPRPSFLQIPIPKPKTATSIAKSGGALSELLEEKKSSDILEFCTAGQAEVRPGANLGREILSSSWEWPGVFFHLDGRLKKRRGPLSLEKGENTHSLLMHQAGPVSVKGEGRRRSDAGTNFSARRSLFCIKGGQGTFAYARTYEHFFACRHALLIIQRQTCSVLRPPLRIRSMRTSRAKRSSLFFFNPSSI